ncbi:MAG: ECF transporter S component [Clostridia bacterium]
MSNKSQKKTNQKEPTLQEQETKPQEQGQEANKQDSQNTISTLKDDTVALPITKLSSPKFFTAKNIARMAILTAVSYILYMFVKFPLGFIFPIWLDIQFSDMPALIGGFAIGPLASVIIIVLKCCLKMPFTSSVCVGELCDILIGIAFVLPASLIYKHKKSKKNALIGIACGMACALVASVLANRLIIIPFYVEAMFGGNWQGLLDVVGKLYNGVTKDTFYVYYICLAVIPFNIIRLTIVGAITYLLYKPLSPLLHN